MPDTTCANLWIVVVVDYFTWWQDAVAILNAIAPVVVKVLNERVFCHVRQPEKIHSNQGVQFESQLMTELCHIWRVVKTRTTSYHSQNDKVKEREHNRKLRDYQAKDKKSGTYCCHASWAHTEGLSFLDRWDSQNDDNKKRGHAPWSIIVQLGVHRTLAPVRLCVQSGGAASTMRPSSNNKTWRTKKNLYCLHSRIWSGYLTKENESARIPSCNIVLLDCIRC